MEEHDSKANKSLFCPAVAMLIINLLPVALYEYLKELRIYKCYTHIYKNCKSIGIMFEMYIALYFSLDWMDANPWAHLVDYFV